MKNLKSILTMGLLFVSTAGFAQFANNGGHSRGGSVLTKTRTVIHASILVITQQVFLMMVKLMIVMWRISPSTASCLAIRKALV